MKNLKRVLKISVIMLTMFCCVSITNNVKAADGMQEIINKGNDFITQGSQQQGSFTEDFFAGEFVGIGQILVSIGVVVLLGVIAYMGIKWIVAKPDQQAVLKQQLIGVVVAAIVIFGAYGIWSFVRRTMQSVQNSIADTESIVVVAENNEIAEK